MISWILLVQKDKDGKEKVLYYLSQALIGVEVNYKPIGKDVTHANIFSAEFLT